MDPRNDEIQVLGASQTRKVEARIQILFSVTRLASTYLLHCVSQ